MSGFIQKDVQNLIKEVALEHNLSIKSVTDIIMSQFEYVRDEVVKGKPEDPGTYKSVTLRYLGTFAFYKNRHTAIEYAKLNKRLKDEGHSSGIQSED